MKGRGDFGELTVWHRASCWWRFRWHRWQPFERLAAKHCTRCGAVRWFWWIR